MKWRNKWSLLTAVLLVAVFGACKKSAFKTYAKPETTINATDNRLLGSLIHFSKDTVYVLATSINIYPGQVLKIDAGTLIKVNDYLSITINNGGVIDAKGTAADPIVFTSSAYKGTPGFVSYSSTGGEHSWLGIIIRGNYPLTGFGSGTLSHARIEFAGSSVNNYTALGGLLLQNVSDSTVIDNIEVSYSVRYSSFNISGGNVNVRNLVSYASGSSDFNISDGYRGLLQNLLAYRHVFFAPQIGSSTNLAGLMVNGDSTFPSISNLTVLGPDLQPGTNPKYSDTTTAPDVLGIVHGSDVAALIVNSGQFRIRNSIFMGFPKGGFVLNNKSSAMSLQFGPSELTYSFLHSSDSSRTFHLRPGVYPPFNSYDMALFLMQSQYANSWVLQASDFRWEDPYAYDTQPKPFPAAGAPELSGANFDGPTFADGFFDKVSYRGALGTDSWMSGWTNFVPLQTNYNN